MQPTGRGLALAGAPDAHIDVHQTLVEKDPRVERHEKQLKRFNLRNIVALVLGALGTGAMIWNIVDHTRAKEGYTPYRALTGLVPDDTRIPATGLAVWSAPAQFAGINGAGNLDARWNVVSSDADLTACTVSSNGAPVGSFNSSGDPLVLPTRSFVNEYDLEKQINGEAPVVACAGASASVFYNVTASDNAGNKLAKDLPLHWSGPGNH